MQERTVTGMYNPDEFFDRKKPDKTCYNCGAPIAKAYCEGFPEVCEHWRPKKRQTNADRIRAMSDEELAEYLSKVQGDIFRGEMRLTFQWLDWLKAEVET